MQVPQAVCGHTWVTAAAAAVVSRRGGAVVAVRWSRLVSGRLHVSELALVSLARSWVSPCGSSLCLAYQTGDGYRGRSDRTSAGCGVAFAFAHSRNSVVHLNARSDGAGG